MDSSNVSQAICGRSVDFSELTSPDGEAMVVVFGSKGPVASGFLDGECPGRVGRGRRHRREAACVGCGRRRWRKAGQQRPGIGTTTPGAGPPWGQVARGSTAVGAARGWLVTGTTMRAWVVALGAEAAVQNKKNESELK
jgi:hypothetical protein